MYFDDQIRRFKRDLWHYQTQPNEQDHQTLKDGGARLVNKASGPAEEVFVKSFMKEIMKKDPMDPSRRIPTEVRVRGYTQTTNTVSEAEQLLLISTMKKELKDRVLTVSQLTREQEVLVRNERTRKTAGDLKLERDVDKFNLLHQIS
jgi:hypothetical protein